MAEEGSKNDPIAVGPALCRVAGEAYGVDFSPRSIELTNERNAHVPNFKGAYAPQELVEMGLEFDGILSVEVIEHLSDGQLAATVELVKQLLEPEGVIVFTTKNDEDLATSRVYCPECDHVFHRWQHLRSWNARSIFDFLTEQGFVDVRTWTTDFSPPLGLGVWGQVRRLARAIANGADTGNAFLGCGERKTGKIPT